MAKDGQTENKGTNGDEEVRNLEKDVEYLIDTADMLTVEIDEDTVLKTSCKKSVRIIFQKPQERSNGGDTKGSNINSKKSVRIIFQKPQERSNGTTPEQQVPSKDNTKGGKNEEQKKSGTEDGKEERSDQPEQGTLQNAITKLKNYKGIVITALIAVSLGFLLRRKFKASVPH